MIPPSQLSLFAAALVTGGGQAQAVIDRPPAKNFRLAGDRSLGATWGERAHANMVAIETMQQIIRENRSASPDEQAKLIQFIGFGASALATSLFPVGGAPARAGWERLHEYLHRVVDDRGIRALARSTQYAHYTPEPIVRALWRAALGLGFTGGRVLEPGCGVGLFFAMAPDEIADLCQFTGIEFEPITAQIATLLYPQASIQCRDFTDTKAPLGQPYDLAIGNPPFSSRVVSTRDVSLSLHEFFVYRSLQNLKPGAVAAFVSSRYLMDKGEPAGREAIGRLAEFVGAVRLPAGAMRARAGTDVVVDLVFLRRHRLGTPSQGHRWTEVVGVPAVSGATQVAVNEYYAQNPRQVLGDHAVVSSQYGHSYSCVADKARPWNDALLPAIDALITQKPTQIIPEIIHHDDEGATDQPSTPQLTELFPTLIVKSVAEGGTVREGSYLVDPEDRLCRIMSGAAVPVDVRGVNAVTGMTRDQANTVRDLIPIRDTLRAVLSAQEEDRPWDDAIAQLRALYDAFVIKMVPKQVGKKRVTMQRGPINSTIVSTRNITRKVKRIDEETGEIITERVPGVSYSYARPNLGPFMLDPDVWLVASIEEHDIETNTARPGVIFSHRVVRPSAAPQINSAADALAVVLNELGRVDIGRIAALLDKPEREAVIELGGLVYEDPETGTWLTADEYLSGPVRKKLAVAEAAAALDPDFVRNVEALRENQPVDLRPSQISLRLGAPYLGTELVQQFAREVLELPNIIIRHNADLNIWDIDWVGFRTNRPASTFGTQRRRVDHLLSDALNSKMPKVFDTHYYEGKKKLELNVKETEAAKEKVHRIKVAFERWAWNDAERAERLVRVYNATMNDLVDRKFDGSHQTFPGLSDLARPRKIQRDFAWQAVSVGSVYNAMRVGYGKTTAAIMAVMEQIRLGLIKKPIVTVPGHTLGQWASEWMSRYPAARILTADEATFTAGRRQEFFARATTGRWDAIICTHEAFKLLPVPVEFESSLIEVLIEQYEEALTRVDDNDKISRKRLEQMKERQEAKLDKLTSRKDDLVTFATLGADYIVADEFQAFRKLSFATNMTGLLGVDPEGSQRAWDMYVKIKYLNSRTPGRAVMALSGTPIVNTMGELFSAQRMIDEEELTRRKLHTFDAWASTFADTTNRIELQPSGRFKPVTRMARFLNVPEVMTMFRQRAFIVQNNDGGVIANMPTIKGGRRVIVPKDGCEPSPLFRKIQQSFARRIEIIEARKGPPKKGDDILLSVIHDGRLVAGDVRMFNSSYPNESENKLNTMIRNLHAIWLRSAENVYVNPLTEEPYPRKGAAQMVFIDLGVPSMAEKRGFSPYVWARSELVAMGVPPSEIAFIHDYPSVQDKLRLRQLVDSGFVRFLFGSTSKMGTGVNFQLRLLALHHFDCPWTFADLEQREGRIDRFGNQNPEYEIYVYATRGSMDATMFGHSERKLTIIKAALDGDRTTRIIQDDDSDVAQLAIAKAIASGDDRLMRHAALSNDVGRLARLRAAFIDEHYAMRARVANAERNVMAADQSIPKYRQDMEAILPKEPWQITVKGETYDDRKAGGGRLIGVLGKVWMDNECGPLTIGEYRGLRLEAGGTMRKFNEQDEFNLDFYVVTPSGRQIEVSWAPKTTWNVVLDRLESVIEDIRPGLTRAITRRTEALATIETYRPRLDETFDLQESLDAKQAELDALNAELANEALSSKKPK